MAQPLTLTLKETIFNKESTINITPELLEYQNISFSKFEIDEIRYGVKAIDGYRFRIGRIYCIDVKSLSGTVLRIKLKSVYGIRKKVLGEKYRAIVNALFENYFNFVTQSFINLFENQVDFDILGITFTQEGILLDKKSQIIPWEDLGTKNYSRYYAIFSKENRNNYKALYYLEDWNTAVLYSVSRYILKAKKLL